MMKRMLLAAVLLCSSGAYGYDAYIKSECVHLNEILGEAYPLVQVQCGFMPGDEKMLPSSLVASALKRNALPAPQMQANFHIKREGVRLDENAVQDYLSAAYAEKYPDKDVRIENVRFGRDVHIAPDTAWSVSADTTKFGAAYGTIVSATMKAGFSYNVKVYETGYLLTDRVRTGDDVAQAVSEELIDVTNLRSPLVRNPENYIAAKSLTRGRPLTADMVEVRPDRLKGDPILLIYNDGTIKLEITGIAEGNAVTGKTFPVRNPTSGKIFSATYQGNGKAVVN